MTDNSDNTTPVLARMLLYCCIPLIQHLTFTISVQQSLAFTISVLQLPSAIAWSYGY